MSIPTFEDYGKATKDLFGGYCFTSNLLFKNKQTPGLVLTTGLKPKGAGFFALEQLADKKKSFSSNWKFRTDGCVDVSMKLAKVAPGLTFKFDAEADASSSDPVKQHGKANLKVLYEEPSLFTALFGVVTEGKAPVCVSGSVSLGDRSDGGVFVGAGFEVDLRNDREDIKDFNVGVEYTKGAFTGTLRSYEVGEALAFSWTNKLSDKWLIGAKVELSADDETSVIFGLQTKLDAATKLKAKMATDGTLFATIERHLTAPALLLNITSQFSPLKSFSPDKFGLKVTMGDL
eukprot:gb/GEZN01010320.1/.p1 GENE.gb/GEZN01010320.1/~~gb/GEZN01010320.1/.p1  ORF type:complete len:289 (+),score=55.92 gb/GEZN01010320.1/:48-914(+)